MKDLYEITKQNSKFNKSLERHKYHLSKDLKGIYAFYLNQMRYNL